MYQRIRVAHEEQDARKRQSTPEVVQPDVTWQAPGLALFNPRKVNPTTVLQMQQQYGNAAVQRMLAKYRPKRASAIQREEDEEAPAAEEQSAPTEESPSESSAEQETPAESQSEDQPVAESEDAPESESEEGEQQPATSEEDSDTEAEAEEPPESESDTDNATDSPSEDEAEPGEDSDDGDRTREIYIQGTPRTVTVEGTGRTSSVLEVGATTTATYSGDLQSNATVNGTAPNIRASGTATCTYSVDCKVDMPSPPSNLEGCEKKEYQKAIDTVLRKHEDEHVKRFKTYEGTTTHQFNVTVANEDDIDALLEKKFLTPNMDSRSKAADTLSGQIDPFNFKADLSACDSPNKKV